MGLSPSLTGGRKRIIKNETKAIDGTRIKTGRILMDKEEQAKVGSTSKTLLNLAEEDLK